MNLLFIDDYYRSFKDQSLLLLKYGFTLDTDNKKKYMTDLVSITIAIAAFMFLNQIIYLIIPNQGHLFNY